MKTLVLAIEAAVSKTYKTSNLLKSFKTY